MCLQPGWFRGGACGGVCESEVSAEQLSQDRD